MTHLFPFFIYRMGNFLFGAIQQTGYFLAGLAEGMDMAEVLRMSAKAASIAVTRPGAAPSIPYRQEVLDALAQ